MPGPRCQGAAELASQEYPSAVYGKDRLDPPDDLAHEILIGLAVELRVPRQPIDRSELMGEDHAGQLHPARERDLELASGALLGDRTDSRHAGSDVEFAR